MRPYKIFENLRAISGSNDKITFLTENLTPELERVFNLTLSSEVRFGIKKIPNYALDEIPTMSLDEALDVLEFEFASNHLTGNARVERLQEVLTCLHAEDAKVVEMVLSKKTDCGVSVQNANKVLKTPIKTFNVMLCAKQDQKLINELNFPCVAQTKMDGMRVIVSVDEEGKVRYRSRNGKDLELNENIDSQFSGLSNIVFDGEMLIKSDEGFLDRKTGNGILNSVRQGKASDEDINKVHFVFWDQIQYTDFIDGFSDRGYLRRFDELSELFIKIQPSNWSLVRTSYPKSFEEAQEFYLEARKNGEEGCILKDGNAPYEAKRVKHQIKMKAEETADLRIIGVEEGTGKNVGRLGAVLCEDETGVLKVNVGSGFTEKEREEFWNEDLIGQIVEVKYNEIVTKKGSDEVSMFLPIFVELRKDKNIPDTLKNLK